MLSSTGLRNRSSRTLLVKPPNLSNNPSTQASGAASSSSHASNNGQKLQNNFVALVLPYLNNSSSWHVREELLNVLIICFLQSRNIFEFDQYAILEALLRSLEDPKERNRFIALEAIVAFSSIGNKLSMKEIIFQLAEKQISELITERLEAAGDMNPYLNE